MPSSAWVIIGSLSIYKKKRREGSARQEAGPAGPCGHKRCWQREAQDLEVLHFILRLEQLKGCCFSQQLPPFLTPGSG